MAFGFIGAVADNVVEDFAAGGFEGAEGVARGDAAGGAGGDVAGGEGLEPVDDAVAGVGGFEHADDDAAGDVAEVGGADVPVGAFAFLVGGAGLGVADVPFDVGGAGGGAGGAEGFADVGFEDANADCAVKDGLFFQHEVGVVGDTGFDFFEAVDHARDLGFLDVMADATNEIVGVVDAVATDFFDDVHAVFTVSPSVVKESVPANFVTGDTEPEDVAVDAVQFVHDAANVEAACWYL